MFSYVVGNRTFKSMEDATQYCNESDFPMEMIQKELPKAKAIRNREGYFNIGDTFKVEKINDSVYRAHGSDWQGYKWNCIVSANSIQLV